MREREADVWPEAAAVRFVSADAWFERGFSLLEKRRVNHANIR
jgi:hypothetical protein